MLSQIGHIIENKLQLSVKWSDLNTHVTKQLFHIKCECYLYKEKQLKYYSCRHIKDRLGLKSEASRVCKFWKENNEYTYLLRLMIDNPLNNESAVS